eukprot:PITA_25317
MPRIVKYLAVATPLTCKKEAIADMKFTYVDDDKDESFYILSWACDVNGSPLLVAGGHNGITRVLDVANDKVHKNFVGHGDSVNEIRNQALKPSLILSASKDKSVRLWNVQTGICILIFVGAGGHRNEVLNVDVYRIASCGMDNTVKIWSMKEFWTYVEKSFTWTDLPSKFPTNKEKSTSDGVVDILQKYPVPECDIWFIKFSCDFHYNSMAVGNREGKVYVWELQPSPPNLIARLSHPHCKHPIRQTIISHDGSTILCCCDDGSMWRWDVAQ